MVGLSSDEYGIENPVTLLPAQNDSGVATEGRIKVLIKGSRIINATLRKFTLSLGDSIIPGTIINTDTSIEFSPDNKLKAYIKYTAEINATIEYAGGDSTSQTNFTDVDSAWSFTTYPYVMTKRSDRVSDFDRDGSKLMQMGEYLYMYGGWTAYPLQSYNDIYRSKGDLSEWEKLEDAPWRGRHTFGIGKIDSVLYVFGGDNLADNFDAWKSTDGYTFIPARINMVSMVGNRILYGACSHNDKLFVLGGQGSLELDKGLSDVWSTPDGKKWTKIASGKDFLAKNISGSVVSYNGKIWVVGGGYYKHPIDFVRWTNEVYSSPDGTKWKKERDAPWLGRAYTDVCVWDNKLWMIGGDNHGNLADIWYMDSKGVWTEFETPDDYIARHATAVGVYNDQLVIACGNYHNDCWTITKGEL